jgi:hypothetical protein
MKKKAKKGGAKSRRKSSVKDLPAKKAGSVKGGAAITGSANYIKDRG